MILKITSTCQVTLPTHDLAALGVGQALASTLAKPRRLPVPPQADRLLAPGNSMREDSGRLSPFEIHAFRVWPYDPTLRG